MAGARARDDDRLTVPGERARVFFALWPDAVTRSTLGGVARHAQAECGGRPTAADKIHTTLFFVGDIERARLARLEAVGAAIGGAPFDLDVDVLRYWKHNRIVWAGATRTPAPLAALVAALTRGLAAEGIRGDDRPYVAHMTLVRNARRAPVATTLEPLKWAARDFVLVESVSTGGASRYDVRQRWPLGGA